MSCIQTEPSFEMMMAQTSPCKVAIRIAAELFDVPQKSIIGPRRSQTLVWARFLAMWAASHAGSTSVQIGRAFGDRDHTTVLNAIERAEFLQEQNPVLRDMGRQMLTRMGLETA